MATKFSFKVELLPKGSTTCSRCNKKIRDKLRVASMKQSGKEDALETEWFDMKCFFSHKIAFLDYTSFDGFAALNNTDKQLFKQQMGKFYNANAHASKNGKKSAAKKRPSSNAVSYDTVSVPCAIDDFVIGYTSNHHDVCHCCHKAIGNTKKPNVVVHKKIHEEGDEITVLYHKHCFTKHSKMLGWFYSAEKLLGFERLKKKDRDYLIPKLKDVTQNTEENNNEPPEKKIRTGTINDVNQIIEKKAKDQNKDFSVLRDRLKMRLTKEDFVTILTHNGQYVPKDESILDHVTDVIFFGPIGKCQKCNTGNFIFRNSTYECTEVGRFANCMNSVKRPKRFTFKIPPEIQEKCHFLVYYSCSEPRYRAIRFDAPKTFDKILTGLAFVVIGLEKSRKEIVQKILAMGGKVERMVHGKTAAVISNIGEVNNPKSNFFIQQAKLCLIQVVPVEFIDAVKITDVFEAINKHNISPWQCKDPAARIPCNAVRVPKSNSFYKEDPVAAIQKWKNGISIDAECKLDDVHVYCYGRLRYTVVMALVDIDKGKNSYYRMQLLESDDNTRYWLFQKYGRISTNIRTPIIVEYESRQDAINAFHELYLEQTGNTFVSQIFEKKPEKYQVLDINYDNREKVLQSLVETKLEPQQYELMKLICDEKAMKGTLLKFNLDTDTLPLGKISKQQIEVASNILNELSVLVKNNGEHTEFIEASNRLYTMIPHSFGVNVPIPVINTAEMIDEKRQMLERLKEIDFTYSLLSNTDDNVNPLDSLHEKINAHISPLNQNTNEYRQIMDYVMGTNDPCGCYQRCKPHKIVLEEIFKVVRPGESDRFLTLEPQISNRRLLWHGSNLTNFVGILSNGLKIAPSEASWSGTRLGKGVYFADAISKSYQYCGVQEGVGLFLLCEVELGSVLEVTTDQRMTSCPNGKNSVKGCGYQWPTSIHTLSDGLQIPSGPIQCDRSIPTEFKYNEYVVYNEAQVKIRYLVKTKLLHQ